MLTILNLSPKLTAKGNTVFTGIVEGHGLIQGFAKAGAVIAPGDVTAANFSQGRDGRWTAFVGY